MMTLKLRIILALLFIIFWCAVVGKSKKRQIELKYAITWILVPLVIVILIVIPGALEWLAGVLGIASVMNMVFILGFLFSLLVIYTLTIALSRHSDRIRSLTQMMALDEYEKRNK